MTMNFKTSDFHLAVKALPDQPSPETSDKYSFIDTKVVVENMLDMGYEIFGYRQPKFRTVAGAFGLHELDFRLPSEMAKPQAEAARILFYNTYDGSRRAQFTAGMFRFICSNGLILGDTFHDQRFLHLGLDEAEFLDQLAEAVEASNRGKDHVERLKTITLDPSQYTEMAKLSLLARYPDEELLIDPATALMPRRREDVKTDLWTTWNVLQENLLTGGLPGRDKGGEVRVSRPVNQIQRSVTLNKDLWAILENTAALA